MGLGVVGADNVGYLPFLRDELIGDEAAVAAPGEGFGAHDGRALLSGEGLQIFERRFEIVGEHVIGVRCERGDLPGRVFRGFAWRSAAAAEGREVGVGDAEVLQCGCECIAIEVRVAAGAGEAADVGEGFDFFGGEQGEEIVQLAVGVADGPDRVGGHSKCVGWGRPAVEWVRGRETRAQRRNGQCGVRNCMGEP
jgi:hypothetical protein